MEFLIKKIILSKNWSLSMPHILIGCGLGKKTLEEVPPVFTPPEIVNENFVRTTHKSDFK